MNFFLIINMGTVVYLIFSKYRKDIRSFSQELEEGGFESFQRSKMHLRATSDAKAVILFSLLVKWPKSSGTLESEVVWELLIMCHKKRTKINSILDKRRTYVYDWPRKQTSGRCVLWTTLNCVRVRLAQGEVVFTLSKTFSHQSVSKVIHVPKCP